MYSKTPTNHRLSRLLNVDDVIWLNIDSIIQSQHPQLKSEDLQQIETYIPVLAQTTKVEQLLKQYGYQNTQAIHGIFQSRRLAQLTTSQNPFFVLYYIGYSHGATPRIKAFNKDPMNQTLSEITISKENNIFFKMQPLMIKPYCQIFHLLPKVSCQFHTGGGAQYLQGNM